MVSAAWLLVRFEQHSAALYTDQRRLEDGHGSRFSRGQREALVWYDEL